MTDPQIQQQLFQKIKEKLPVHMALVDEVADLLHMSSDSAYRRIRCEKALTIDELRILAHQYNVSTDELFKISKNSISFHGDFIDKEAFGFENYLRGIVQQVSGFVTAQQKELFYLNKDIPIFHHFMFPELAAFKCYFWSRYNLNLPQFNRGQFLISDFVDIFNETGKKISELYLQIPSTEIWNLDCINTTIRQIQYYRDSNIFKSKEDIEIIFRCLEKLVNHIEQQVEMGCKFPYAKPDKSANVSYRVFVNEFLLGDNTIAVELDGRKVVFLNHSVINYVMTTDPVFVDKTFDALHILLKKSTLISEVGEKDRHLFFENLRERINNAKK